MEGPELGFHLRFFMGESLVTRSEVHYPLIIIFWGGKGEGSFSPTKPQNLFCRISRKMKYPLFFFYLFTMKYCVLCLRGFFFLWQFSVISLLCLKYWIFLVWVKLNRLIFNGISSCVLVFLAIYSFWLICSNVPVVVVPFPQLDFSIDGRQRR